MADEKGKLISLILLCCFSCFAACVSNDSLYSMQCISIVIDMHCDIENTYQWIQTTNKNKYYKQKNNSTTCKIIKKLLSSF